MAESINKNKQSNPLVGSGIQPVTLDNTTSLDIDTKNTLVDNIIEAGLASKLDIAALENFTSVSNARDQVYQLIDTMAQDSSVAAILRTYAEDVCEPADNGHVIWCESDDPKISKFVNYMLNIMNADKNMYAWAYSLIKYGDVYLRLFRESDYADELFKADDVELANSSRNILNEAFNLFEEEPKKPENKLDEAVNLNIHEANDHYSYYAEQIDDPGTMFELTKFGRTYGYIEVPNTESNLDATTAFSGTSTTGTYNFRMKSTDVTVFQAVDFVHACLEDNFSRFPETVDLFIDDENKKSQSYSVRRGKSLLYDSYKIWREKALLENAALLNRITRSSIVRKVGVEVGDMPKEQVQQTLRRVKEMLEQKGAINVGESMSEYNNPGPIENNIYFATHGGQGNITIEAVGGDVEVKNLADLDWWNNKFYSSYGIPKQYFGWCLKFDTPILLLDGTTHTIEELYKNKAEFVGKGILGCNSDGSLCPTKIKDIILTNPSSSYMRIWLDNGKYVDVTADHRMMLRDGSFKPAGDLVEGESLMPYYDKIKDGRRFVLDNKTGKFVPQYHVVSAKKGEAPEAGYNIHHINKIKIDDDFTNLIKLSTKDHCLEHGRDLALSNKEANCRRREAGENTNANVGSRYITNGIYYTTIKAGETLPDGFWFEGPKKPESMKQAMSEKMLGRKKNYDNTSHLNVPEVQRKSLESRQKTYDKMTGRKDFYVRCPVCGEVFTKHITDSQYNEYINKDKFYYCSETCRKNFDGNGAVSRAIKLYNKLGRDINSYDEKIKELKNSYLSAEKLQNKLTFLEDYVPEVNHKVAKIEYFNELVPVYDITVEDDCHTFALPCGIFVHNCDDGAGFNGGTSLTILSSVYAKGVKRVQNALIQALTDAVNLFLLDKGCKSYLNNFTLRMKAPMTQEEVDYRAGLANQINAISSMQGLFTDIEDKPRRLRILKQLLAVLNYGDEINAEIDAEIRALEEAAANAALEAENNQEGETGSSMDETSEEAPPEDDTDLGTLAALESFDTHGKELLVEEQDFKLDDLTLLTEDDLPSPSDLDAEKDFSENK